MFSVLQCCRCYIATVAASMLFYQISWKREISAFRLKSGRFRHSDMVMLFFVKLRGNYKKTSIYFFSFLITQYKSSYMAVFIGNPSKSDTFHYQFVTRVYTEKIKRLLVPPRLFLTLLNTFYVHLFIARSTTRFPKLHDCCHFFIFLFS